MKKILKPVLAVITALSLFTFTSCAGESDGKKAARDCYEVFLNEGPDALKERIMYYGDKLNTLEDLEDFQEEMERLGLF